MQDEKNVKINKEKNKTEKLLSFHTYIRVLKRFFILWLIAVIIIGFISVGISFIKTVSEGKVSTVISFSFDGIESGLDPSGNKFDINEVKSKKNVKAALDELGMSDEELHDIIINISIDGIVPLDVIDRIIEYTPVFESNEVVSSKNIQDTSYYPTQYNIELEYNQLDLNQSEAIKLLNKITEKYKAEFYDTFGYNTALETAINSVDYTEYDYVDAVDIFYNSLGSLKNYIEEISLKDNTRFKADNGYTFSDVSSSIDTIRNEDLDWVSSYITLNNVTKDKNILIANYEYKIEELNRSKIISEEVLKSVTDAIDVYEKNSILIFANATDGANSSLNQSSEIYDELIAKKIATQGQFSSCEQKIKLYERRIKSLKTGTSQEADREIVEAEFEKISKKVNDLLIVANQTASEYYEDVMLNNAYSILVPASGSIINMIKSVISDSFNKIVVYELLLASVYLTFCVVASYVEIPFEFKFKRTKKDAYKKNKTTKKK